MKNTPLLFGVAFFVFSLSSGMSTASAAYSYGDSTSSSMECLTPHHKPKRHIPRQPKKIKKNPYRKVSKGTGFPRRVPKKPAPSFQC